MFIAKYIWIELKLRLRFHPEILFNIFRKWTLINETCSWHFLKKILLNLKSNFEVSILYNNMR